MDNENKGNQVPESNVSAADELAAIKAQLDEEQKAKATLEEATAGKDTRIAALEAQVTEFESQRAEFTTQLEGKTKELEASAAKLATASQVKDEAVGHYLDMAKALYPTIPEGIVTGDTIEEIDESVKKGKAIVEAVKKTMEAEAAGTKVPAGAPTRGAISTEGMSPRDMIAAGIKPKGGS